MNSTEILKRKPSKIRKPFMYRSNEEEEKQPEEEIELPQIEYLYQFLSDNQVRILNEFCGMVEVNQKIEIRPEYVNYYVKAYQPKIIDELKQRIVTFDVIFNNLAETLPWKYIVKRLESFGDSGLHGFAQKVRRLNEMLPDLISKYKGLLISGDLTIQMTIQKLKSFVMLRCREIENSSIYRKATFYSGEEVAKLLGMSYSASFLKKMGFTPENFVPWIQENQIPRFIDIRSPAYCDAVTQLLESLKSGNYAFEYEKPGAIVLTNQKSGLRKVERGKNLMIIDPMPEGFMMYFYFIIDKKESNYKKLLRPMRRGNCKICSERKEENEKN